MLQLNSAWTGAGGKTLQALPDTNSAGKSITNVVDAAGRSYVLSIDGKRMAVTRFTATGQIDTSWTSSGTYILPAFTLSTVQDTPTAMVIDTATDALYVTGVSNNLWAIARINAATINTQPIAWQTTLLTGAANGLWLDSSDDNEQIGVAGSTAASQINTVSQICTWSPTTSSM